MPALASSTELKKALADPEANPLTVADLLDQATTREWRGWLPEAVWDFTGLADSQIQQRDKVMAVQVALTNPDVFEDWPLFTACNSAFNHRRANFTELDAPTALEAAWTCDVLHGLRNDRTFGPDLRRYLVAIMQHDGMVYFPWAGISLASEDWAKGLIDPQARTLAAQVEKLWPEVKDLEPSDVDDQDALHTQLAKLVRCATYIRSQKARA